MKRYLMALKLCMSHVSEIIFGRVVGWYRRRGARVRPKPRWGRRTWGCRWYSYADGCGRP